MVLGEIGLECSRKKMNSQEMGENERWERDFSPRGGYLFTGARKIVQRLDFQITVGCVYMWRDKIGVNDSGAFTAPLFMRGNRRDYDH